MSSWLHKLKICSVILAGGSGTRLWPLSRSMRPKQFLPVVDKLTMFQSTLKRLDDIRLDSTIVICNEDHRFFVSQQLSEIGHDAKIIVEPVGKNTAPAIALAAHECDDETLMLVSSADHNIKNESAFIESIKCATRLAEKGKFITFGTKPDRPHTGYGYIKKGEKILDGFVIEEFIEKPDIENAKNYISSNKYCWNSGIFMFKTKNYLDELNQYRPDIAEACKKSMNDKFNEHNFLRINEKEFLKCPSDSVDYAIMEHTKNAVVIPIDVGWSDIGSWNSLWESKSKDKNNNFVDGDVLLHDVKNSFAVSNDKLLTMIGVKDLIVVSTKDSILISHKERSEEVKEMVNKLQKLERPEHQLDREVYRPWGKYDSVDNDIGFQVKRITVSPGEKLSIQRHKHRSEHWIVVKGKATVTKNEKIIEVDSNEHTYIPVGMIHALENKEKDDLILIEIQTGTYFGEDDIERFEDIYGRT